MSATSLVSSSATRFDFSVKTPLTDATLVIEGKKIYVGKDFLSIHSPFFRSLFYGKIFAEKDKTEFELEFVAYDKFLEMLHCLYDTTRAISDEEAASLLLLADRFDIKCLTDWVENILINDHEPAEVMLLLADRHRLNNLERTIYCHNIDDVYDYVELKNRIQASPEFEMLSEGAERAYFAASDNTSYPSIADHSLVPDSVTLLDVQSVEEPADGFPASGILGARFYDPLNRPSVNIGGLNWSLKESFTTDHNGEKYLAPYLIANFGYLSSVEWSAEGYVEVSMTSVSKSTGRDVRSMNKKYAFSLKNAMRVGQLDRLARASDFPRSPDLVHFANITISVTESTGVRKSPKFDFTNPSELTDAVFIVEGRKIHVNKQYMSTLSGRFQTMFDECSEVVLHEIKFQEMLEFIRYIYLSHGKISVSSMFDVLMVARKLGYNEIDTTSIDEYWSGHCFFSHFYAEKIIFYYSFDTGIDANIMNYRRNPVWCRNEKQWAAVYTMIKNSPLLSKMTAEAKNDMYEWMMGQEYDA